MPFPWISVAGFVVLAWLVFKHHDWIVLILGRRGAMCAVVVAGLVLYGAAEYRKADFSKGLSWIVQQGVREIQPWFDRSFATVWSPTTTSTTAVPTVDRSQPER